ncbi:MAG: InlB B-repeat-containing protein [Bacteroidota bacterium]|nr:InlB B-repeat-containing protein [Bacteroidota bacterium]
MKKLFLFFAILCVQSLPMWASSFKLFNIDPNGGANTMIAHNLISDIGSSFIITNPTRAGYTFTGWTGTGTTYLSRRGFTGSGANEVSFNGTSDYYDLGRTYMYTDRITVNLWAYMDNWSEYSSVNMRLISCTQTGGWSFETSSNRIRFACYDSGKGYKSLISSMLWSDLAAGWHMFTLTFDGTNVRGYVDGVLQGAGKDFESGAIGYNATNSILLGAEAGAGSTPAGNYFKGKIRDVTIVNATLSTKDVAKLYNEGNVSGSDNAAVVRYYVPEANTALKASWSANAATTLTIDANGGVNSMSSSTYSQAAGTSLTITNPTKADATFKCWDANTNKYISNYQGFTCSSPQEVSFNGSSTYYDLGRTYMFTDVITVNLWGYMSSWADYANGMRMISCTEKGGWNIEHVDGYIRFAIYDGAAKRYRSFISSKKWSEISAGWHMFTLTFDGTLAVGFLDGQEIARSTVFNGEIGYNASNSILIGAEAGVDNLPAGSYFNGKLKNICIMNVAITADDVAELYANQGVARYFFPKHNATLKAVWEGGGTTPIVSVSPNSLSFNTTVGSPTGKTINVSGANLTGDITLALSGVNAEQFILSTTTIPKLESAGTVTVTYNPLSAGTHVATVTVSSAGASAQNVQLSGTSTQTPPGPEVPTLTKVWETPNVLPLADARYGTGYGGKIFANDATNKILYYWNSEGCQKAVQATSVGGGWACKSDNAGNILINTGKWGTSFTDWQVQPLSGGAAQTLTLSAPSGVTTGYIYNNITVIGDLLSESGAVLYLLPHQQTVAAKILVKSGVQNAASYACSYAIEGAYSNEDAVAPFNIPFGSLTSETFMWRNRSTAGINYFNGSEVKSYTEPSTKCNNTGFDAFKLNGVEYGVVPTGTYCADGFSVFTLPDGEVVASRPETKVTTGAYYVSIKVEEVSPTKVNIYYYKAGDVAAMYTFEVPSSPTGVEDIQILRPLIYTSARTLYVEGIIASHIDLYSITGQKVLSAENVNTLSLGSLTGVFVAQITDVSGVVYTEKVVVK